MSTAVVIKRYNQPLHIFLMIQDSSNLILQTCQCLLKIFIKILITTDLWISINNYKESIL